MDKFHTRMRMLREQFGLSQEYVGSKLGISQQAYSNYEMDKGEISVKHAVELAGMYNVSTDYLLGISDEPQDVVCLDAEFVGDLTFGNIVDRLQN